LLLREFTRIFLPIFFLFSPSSQRESETEIERQRIKSLGGELGAQFEAATLNSEDKLRRKISINFVANAPQHKKLAHARPFQSDHFLRPPNFASRFSS